jgi:AraC-like DNA-binding protein
LGEILEREFPLSTVVVIDVLDETANALQAFGFKIEATFTLKKANQSLDELAAYPLIVIGVSFFPIRRNIITRLRRSCPNSCLISLRQSIDPEKPGDWIVADFYFGSSTPDQVWKSARKLTRLFPIRADDSIAPQPDIFKFERILELLNSGYPDPDFSLERLAKQFGTNPAALSRLFNRFFRKGFRTKLTEVRIAAAKALLTDGQDRTIREIARLVGFSDSDYFSRVFKSITGQRASDFRNDQRRD